MVGAAVGAWGFCIILSTYFVKQHVIADSIAGVAVAYLVFRLGFSEWLYGYLRGLGNLILRRKGM
jgi:hypothetical protein